MKINDFKPFTGTRLGCKCFFLKMQEQQNLSVFPSNIMFADVFTNRPGYATLLYRGGVGCMFVGL